MNCQWTRNHQVFYPHMCASRNCVQTSEAPQNMAGLQFDGQLVKQLSRLASTHPPSEWVSAGSVLKEFMAFMASHDIKPLKEYMRKGAKGHLKFELIELVRYHFFSSGWEWTTTLPLPQEVDTHTSIIMMMIITTRCDYSYDYMMRTISPSWLPLGRSNLAKSISIALAQIDIMMNPQVSHLWIRKIKS